MGLVFLGLIFLALYPCGKKSSIRSQFYQKYVKTNSIFCKIVSCREKIFFQIPKSEKNWDLEEQKNYQETISFSESLPRDLPCQKRRISRQRIENPPSRKWQVPLPLLKADIQIHVPLDAVHRAFVGVLPDCVLVREIEVGLVVGKPFLNVLEGGHVN